MASVYFRVPLVCTHCHTHHTPQAVGLYTRQLSSSAGDIQVDPGDVVDLFDSDFDDAYLQLHAPSPTASTIAAIEMWGCPVCAKTQSVRLDFDRIDLDHHRFVGAAIIALTQATLDDAHYISRELAAWSPNPGDDIELVIALRNHGLT